MLRLFSPCPPLRCPQLWAFFPRGAVDRWATREQDRAQLMGKQLSLERLLSVPELLASCQLVLQPPGTLMVIPPVREWGQHEGIACSPCACAA